ncbi:ATP-binding protein [Nocardioidaceae bacterium]|nr:ATP-binding protein [Nocardioidaceae bacterium]
MHPGHDELHLEAVPASVGQARRMVAATLHSLGREDLVGSAQLVVSELVTNALLHGVAPVTARVRGTRAHPRVEISDASMRLPRLPEAPLPLTEAVRPTGALPAGGALTFAPEEVDALLREELDLLSMGGRGIRLVITYSAAWGIHRTTGCKTVWFEPSAEPRTDAPNEIQVFETIEDETLPLPRARRSLDDLSPATGPQVMRHVRLVNAPVRLIAAVRSHYDDLQREIRLIGLQYGRAAATLPRHLFEQAAHPELHRLRALGVEQVEQAVLVGRDHADLDYEVAPADAAVFARTVALFLEADEFCRRERLLTLALTERQRAAVIWFVDQVVSQVAGRAPCAWDEAVDARA